MTEARRTFARWQREPDPGHGYAQIPADGACLSVFLIVLDPNDGSRVLLGSPNPASDWERIGALEPTRLSRIADRWMLPASHLIESESPQEAALRVATEQLGQPALAMDGPEVVSDSYTRPGAEGRHWDLDFLFRSTWPSGVAVRAEAWTRLELLDPRSLPRARFARAHDDILRIAGFETGA